MILSAWDCDVFENDPQDIARMFADLLRGEFGGGFERVIMATYDKTPNQEILSAFRLRF